MNAKVGIPKVGIPKVGIAKMRIAKATTRKATFALVLAAVGNYAAAQSLDAGKRQYQARCVGCHGEDGSGGGHGPNIVDVRRPRATTLEAVRALIIKGIPDGGMPAFPMSEAEA